MIYMMFYEKPCNLPSIHVKYLTAVHSYSAIIGLSLFGNTAVEVKEI